MQNSFTSVEKSFFELQNIKNQKSSIPYLTVLDFPSLGLLTSLRFFEWVYENPNGVISLPTGKTPEYFIKWTNRFLDNWDNNKLILMRKRINSQHQIRVKLRQGPTLDKVFSVRPG